MKPAESGNLPLTVALDHRLVALLLLTACRTPTAEKLLPLYKWLAQSTEQRAHTHLLFFLVAGETGRHHRPNRTIQ